MKDEENELEMAVVRVERLGQDESAMMEEHQTSSFCLHPSALHCATCGDEALSAIVLRLDSAAGMALVTVDDTTIEVDISLVDALTPGDCVLIHGGVAIAKL